jgi:hypothetical protein
MPINNLWIVKSKPTKCSENKINALIMAQKVSIRKTERGVNRNGIYRKIHFYGENSAQRRAEKQNISIYMQYGNT